MKTIKLITLILLTGFSYSVQAQLLDDLDCGKTHKRISIDGNVKETVKIPVIEVYSDKGELIATGNTNNFPSLVTTLTRGKYTIVYRQEDQFIRTERVHIK